MLKIRTIIGDDRKHIERMLITKKVFNQDEIDLALELIDQTLAQPQKDDYTILCACQDEARIVAGYICFGPIPLAEGCYDIYWILVDNKFSRRGIGTELLQTMEEQLLHQNARRVYIDTSSTTPYLPARKFYEKHGFWIDCVLENFYREGDDKIIYVKDL